MLGNTAKEQTKFTTKNWVEINDESRGSYNTNIQIRFKTSISRTSLCDYSDACILVKDTVIVVNTETAAAPSNADKKIIFKNCTP